MTINQYVLSNGTRVIVSQRVSRHDEDGYTVELVLNTGFETEQVGLYDSVEAALEAGLQWAEEGDWSDYQ